MGAMQSQGPYMWEREAEERTKETATGKGSQAKGCEQPPEPGKGKKTCLRNLQKEIQPCSHLVRCILDF